jgi:hypothetical protein
MRSARTLEDLASNLRAREIAPRLGGAQPERRHHYGRARSQAKLLFTVIKPMRLDLRRPFPAERRAHFGGWPIAGRPCVSVRYGVSIDGNDNRGRPVEHGIRPREEQPPGRAHPHGASSTGDAA